MVNRCRIGTRKEGGKNNPGGVKLTIHFENCPPTTKPFIEFYQCSYRMSADTAIYPLLERASLGD